MHDTSIKFNLILIYEYMKNIKYDELCFVTNIRGYNGRLILFVANNEFSYYD